MRLLLLILTIPCFADDYYRQVVLQTSGLVSYWRLGESSGNFTDIKGGNTATANGGITYSASGAILEDSNTAVTFNGSTGYANVANRTPFAFEYNQAFSMECWIYRTGSGYTHVMGKVLGTGSDNPGYFIFNDNDFTDLFIVNSLASNKYIQVQYNAVSANAWHHIVATYDGSGAASGALIYVDGALGSGRTVVKDTLASSSILAAADFTIAARPGGACCFWTGRIDEVAVYSGVMSAADVALHYHYGVHYLSSAARSTGSPLNVILDNDTAVDEDNFYQIQQFARLAQLGYYNVLAFINSDSTTYGVVCADLLLRYSGFAPRIGAYQLSDAQSANNTNCNSYAGTGLPGKDRTNYTDDVTVYREVLQNAANGSVTLIVAASAVSLYNLMTTAGTPSGTSLITDKVARLYWVAGNYASGTEFNFGGGGGSPPAAYRTTANYVLANWPTSVPIDFIGITEGDPLTINSTDNYYSRPNGSPFNTLTYTARSDWDGLANWATSLASYLSSSGHANGTNVVDSGTGANTWTSTPNAGMSYLTKTQADSVYIALGNRFLTYPSHPWGAIW